MLSFRLSLLPVCCALLATLALSSAKAAPVVSKQIPDLTVYDSTPANEIDLNNNFSDPTLAANTVRLSTDLGDIDVTLDDQQAPITVDNFLRYIDSGAYTPPDPNFPRIAPIFFHRSVPGFVIQSGGYTADENPASPPDALPGAVPTFSPIPNEFRPDLSNVRGSIAMAKVSGDANSATSQWFINLADNGGAPNNLDTTDGGYTVFGQVSTAGMTVADSIAAVPIYDATSLYGAAFGSLPLQNFTNGNTPTVNNLVKINTITRPLIFSATSSNSAVATASVISNDLYVQGAGVGTATITVTATDANAATATQSFKVTVESTPVHAANISTRVQVGLGQYAMIGGFIISGTEPKRLLVRALGPSLASQGVSGTLPDPTLSLYDSKGNLLSYNATWDYAPNKRDIMDSGLAPQSPAEPAILTTLPATTAGSAYTAVVQSASNTIGISLVEVYDLDSGPGSSLLNISTRGDVQTGDNVMIGGFIIGGSGTQQILVRAIGPSLAAYGVTNPLSDPTVALYDAQGNVIDSNDNWQDNPDEAAIMATGIAPTNALESAVLDSLANGSYTAIVKGAGGVTGNGLVEVYLIN